MRALSRRLLAPVVVGGLVLLTLPNAADAVILQVNGKIIPQTAAIQPGLNKGENGTPYTNTATPPNLVGAGPKGAIDPVFEAAESPQVFAVPRLANNSFATVEFVDLLEGAGYENTFGWYNVGDDLSVLSNLHSVLTCTPSNYEPTPTSPSSLSVNFQTEYTAGRYKGGFIGFFLVTPEGQSGGTNCGNPLTSAGVGRIYYTEKEINGDGNYVHYLVYQSKVTDAQGKRNTDFYFGFEDLYRGGDDDFEDMLIFVRGLVVPCVPSSEICDGKDNNCDGLVDNNPTDTGGSCATLPGNNPGVGECKAGVLTCASTGPGDTTKTCVGEVGPVAEACNGKDDNCDATPDNPSGGVFVPALPNACPAQTTPCSASTQCINGVPSCVVVVGPIPETCNGVDDDCNGKTDDNPSDVGVQCTPTGVEPTIGECAAGQTVCSGGKLSCVGYLGPAPEVCDGKDNDCDGAVDEAPLQGLNPQCVPQGIEVCSLGAEQCVNGVKVCTGFTFGSPEICDGLDNDCDGTIDEDPIDVGAPCGSDVGQCDPGLLQCLAQTPGDPSTDTVVCVGSSLPDKEICDGIDNDCDGFVDEDPDGAGPQHLDGVGDPCGSGECGSGLMQCKNGQLACITNASGKQEICNGKDDDCNGIIDDNLTDANGACGINAGACEPGTWQCLPTTPGDLTTDLLQCVGGVGPQPEICNGIDDDCDGFIDEDPDGSGPEQIPGAGEPCSDSDAGLGPCGAGLTACANGVIVCKPSATVAPETCNGIDDDCDGQIDEEEDLIDVGGACGSSIGACKPGVWTCTHDTEGNATKECVGATEGTEEVCNNIDDDCDGAADEGDLPGENVPCPPDGMTLPLQGLCSPGKMLCLSGEMKCVGAVGPSEDICDGLDNDCDGTTDQPDPCPGESVCIAGVCSKKCSSGGEFSDCPLGQVCKSGYCTPIDCTGKCAGGTVCNPKTGLCEAADGGAAGAAGSAGSGGAKPDGGKAGAGGGSSGNAGSAGSTSTGGSTSAAGAGNPEDSDGDGKPDKWGLATGGGGCACGTSPNRVPFSSALLLSLVSLATILRRRSSRTEVKS